MYHLHAHLFSIRGSQKQTSLSETITKSSQIHSQQLLKTINKSFSWNQLETFGSFYTCYINETEYIQVNITVHCSMKGT